MGKQLRLKTARQTVAEYKDCIECGGPKRGRGFTHKPGCSQAVKTARAAKGGFSMASLKGLDVEQLIGVRGQIDKLISDRKPELKEKIKNLEALLKKIEP